jgi:hypothetical protein
VSADPPTDSQGAAEKAAVLQETSFGERIAEQEVAELSRYFVETDQWRRLFAGEVDIVYGPKGAGKSALYSLLVTKTEELFDRGIVILAAETTSGSPAFSSVVTEPPTTEEEFVGLWKFYFAGLIGEQLREWGVANAHANALFATLEQAGLLKSSSSTLQGFLQSVRRYVRAISRGPQAVEGGVTFDPTTGMPTGVSGKITLREPEPEQVALGVISVDALLNTANDALRDSELLVWLLLDRLDVAFATHEALEENALRALFKAYLDMQPLDRIRIKVFLRSDIWRRITESGFREASHITRHLTISWERMSLLNLLMRRTLKNDAICRFYGLDREDVLGSASEQENLLLRMFPDQVDAGRNPATFDWMLSRCQDGSGRTAPRELIHLLSTLRESQIKRLEVGQDPPPAEQLFDRPAFKEALREVSEVRLTQTLYAEYPDLRPFLERLEREKAQQTIASLATIWEVDEPEARKKAEQLVEIGFFERRGRNDQPAYWVPFLYRDALSLVQGEAR